MRIDIDFQTSENIDIGIQESNVLNDSSLETGTYMDGIDPDYEKLKNLPSVNGNTIIGDKTTAELGIGIVGVYNNKNLTLKLL